jgi:hypothetical protein
VTTEVDGEWRWHRTKRGRPPERGEAATAKVTVRFTPAEIKLVRALIGRASMSKWIRDVAMKAARRGTTRP